MHGNNFKVHQYQVLFAFLVPFGQQNITANFDWNWNTFSTAASTLHFWLKVFGRHIFGNQISFLHVVSWRAPYLSVYILMLFNEITTSYFLTYLLFHVID